MSTVSDFQSDALGKLAKIPTVNPGDTIRVHLKIKEGEKERTQVFEGLVIKKKGNKRETASITVRKIASGVGVERIFPLISPSIQKIELVKKAKVRRANLGFIRKLTGKAARLKESYVSASQQVEEDKEGSTKDDSLEKDQQSQPEMEKKEEETENTEAKKATDDTLVEDKETS